MNDDPSLESLLNRPIEQRVREYQYRFAQSAVFGIPVIFLKYFGPSLGGAESEKWAGLLQAVLTGWVTYVGAAGMMFEGMLLASRGRWMADLPVAVAAVGMYLFSAVAVLGVLIRGDLFYRPLLFHWVILLLVAWTGYRWRRLARQSY